MSKEKTFKERMMETFEGMITAKGYVPQPANAEQIAANAIRAMFFHKQYDGVVPVSDLEIVNNSKNWHKLYGDKAVKNAIKELKKDEYINLSPNKEAWLWSGDMHDMLFPKDS